MEIKNEKTPLSLEQIEQCILILESLNTNTDQIFDIPLEQRTELLKQAGLLSRPEKVELRRRKRNVRKNEEKIAAKLDKLARNKTGIRSAREASVFVAPKMIALTGENQTSKPKKVAPREYYVCKEMFTDLHHFYDTMCESCGDFNYAKRFQTADLTRQTALVTGSRLKIGYYITLMMLRAGATVIATTRFPIDSALRFAKEEDFET